MSSEALLEDRIFYAHPLPHLRKPPPLLPGISEEGTCTNLASEVIIGTLPSPTSSISSLGTVLACQVEKDATNIYRVLARHRAVY